MWHGVGYGVIATAAAICAAISLVIGSVMQAGIFHRFHRLTPNTWRPEGPTRYALGAAARVLVGLGFPLLYIYTGMGQSETAKADWLMVGLKFGALAWLGLSLPQTLSTTNFVNVHKGFVVGLILDWLVICLLCGAACARFVQY